MQGDPITDHPKLTDAAAFRFAREGLARINRYLIACVLVGISAVVAETLADLFDTTRMSMVFLGAVLIAAVSLGMGAAIFAALLAFLLYNFFLSEPRFTIRFAGPEDVLVLLLFLSVALLTAWLAGRLRDERDKSQARARSLEALFDATRVMSATEAEATLRERLAIMLAKACDGPVRVLPPGQRLDFEGLGFIQPSARRKIEQMLAGETDEGGEIDLCWRVRPLTVDGLQLGHVVLRLPWPPKRANAEIDRLTQILTDVGASALARARMGSQRSEAELVLRTERLRTALLSSISHDFRTPLAAILASATSLAEYDAKFDAETRRDLLTTIQEEAERLNRFVGNLLNMTKLESGALELQLSPVPAEEVVASAAARVRRRRGAGPIGLAKPAIPAVAMADPVLLEQVLINLLENALAFSPGPSEVAVTIGRNGRRVEIEVADHGPGVAPADLPKIFDKFYRAADARQAGQGTGLGLPISKGLIEAMGGSILARPRPDGTSGLSVVLSLPSES